MFAALFAAVFVLVLLTAGPVWDQIVEFVHALPGYWEELTLQAGVPGASSPTAGTDDKIASLLKDLAAGLPDAASALLGAAAGIFGSVLSLVTLTFLALFLVMERPTITDWLFGFTSPAVDARWRPVLEDAIQAVSSSLIGNVAISVVAGTVAGVSAWALGLPFPLVLAMITGFLDLIPQVGATIAAVILVAVALTVGTTEAVIMLVIQLIYQQLENYVVYPIVYKDGGRAVAVHHDRRGVDRRRAPRRRRRDPRRAVRRRRQERDQGGGGAAAGGDAGAARVAAQVAGTSAPPSWAIRAPKRISAGCGEILPATSASPSLNVGRAVDQARAGRTRRRPARSAVSAAELSRISTRLSHCEMTFSCTFCGRWVETSR